MEALLKNLRLEVGNPQAALQARLCFSREGRAQDPAWRLALAPRVRS